MDSYSSHQPILLSEAGYKTLQVLGYCGTSSRMKVTMADARMFLFAVGLVGGSSLDRCMLKLAVGESY